MTVPGARFSTLPFMMGFFSVRMPYHNDGAPDTSSELAQDMAVLNDESVDDVNEETEEVDLEDGKPPKKKTTQHAETEEDAEEDENEEEDDEEEEESEDEEESDDEDEDDEEEDEDKEETDEDKEKKKLPPVQGRPTVKDIKERVPDLFKVLPGLRPIYFEHEQYAKVFPTPQVAQEAANKAGEYDFIEETLVLNTDPEPLFETIANNNPKAFKAMVMKIPDALEKLDRGTFLEFTEPILERFVASMAAHAAKIGDQNLAKVARHCANFAFANGGEIPDPAKRKAQGPHPAEAELQREREQYAQREHQRAATEINDRIKVIIRDIALEGVPKETSDFIKRGLVRDLTGNTDSELAKDAAFKTHMTSLWRRARTAQYSKESVEGIFTAWTSRAKPLLKDLARKLRQEALIRKVKPRKDGDTKEREQEERPRKKHFKSSQKTSSQSSRRRVLDPSKIDYRKTSDMDILNDNIKFKGDRR